MEIVGLAMSRRVFLLPLVLGGVGQADDDETERSHSAGEEREDESGQGLQSRARHADARRSLRHRRRLPLSKLACPESKRRRLESFPFCKLLWRLSARPPLLHSV